MSMLTIKNNDLTVQVNPTGAELSGICENDSGYEFLWQRDPSVWAFTSPLLFPIAGRLVNDQYTYQGKSYTLTKHGFVRPETFAITEHSESKLTLTYADCEKHWESYPFQFSLSVEYVLTGRTLTICHKVENKQDTPIYFSVGAHPAFRCLTGGYLEFAKPETLQAQRTDAESIVDREEPFLNNETIFPIKPDTFDKDVYLLEGFTSPYVWVRNPAENHSVKVNFGNAPFVGIWAKPNAPYVCIEPWCGISDDYKHNGEIEKKKGIVSLPAGETFTFTYSIEV